MTLDQYPEIKQLMDDAYADLGGAWPKHTIKRLISDFPEGQLGILDDGKLVGLALSVQVSYQRFANPHTYEDIVGTNDQIKSDKDGDALYGLDVVIGKTHRGLRLGRRLYDARKELCRQYNLRAILAGGRIPQYHNHKKDMTPMEYIEKVDRKELYDPIFRSNGY